MPPATARDLAVPYPVVAPDAPAHEAAELLAREDVEAVLVQEGADGELVGVVSDLGLLDLLVPRYVVEDPALARVLDDDATAECWQRVEEHTAKDLVRKDRETPTVDADASPVEIGAAMTRTRAHIVAVVDADGRLLGGITSSALIKHLAEQR